MQLRVDETYQDDLNIKWSVVHKVPSGGFIAFSHEPMERVRLFSPVGLRSGFTSIQLRELEKEWFGIEITMDSERKLVNGTWRDKEEATKQANESWWKYQPKVVRLYAEEIK